MRVIPQNEARPGDFLYWVVRIRGPLQGIIGCYIEGLCRDIEGVRYGKKGVGGGGIEGCFGFCVTRIWGTTSCVESSHVGILLGGLCRLTKTQWLQASL